MSLSKANIIARLQKEILPLEGFKHAVNNTGFDGGLGVIKHAFPNDAFPVGAVHEFLCNGSEGASASSGFIAGIVSGLMKSNGASVWISSTRMVFPPALKSFGINPEQVIFITLKKEKEILWATEEALKCEGLAAVITEVQEVSFTASRRLQLAVEQSKVTGFLLRQNPKNLTTTCITRWKITPSPTIIAEDKLPGLGFPCWNVELVKVRNGKPGSWQLQWAAGKFKPVYKLASIDNVPQRKAG